MIDFDQNGTIKYDEFLTATVDVGKFMTSNNINSIFSIFDFDNDGFITPENIVQSFTNIGEVISIEEAKAIIR
jgi:Ca2+-binding EF-hand superfamily protein